MTDRVLLRAKTGAETGMGHAMRTRAVAQEVLALGGIPLVVVDEAGTREALASESFTVTTVEDTPDWTAEQATGAWLDGFVDWTEELDALRAAGTFTFLVENRTAARERCDRLVYPALHYVPDEWDRRNGQRVYSGAEWIPLARDVVDLRPSRERDVDLLVTFGGCDPNGLTERVLAALDLTGKRVVVSVGPHMSARRSEIEELASEGEDARVLFDGTPLGRWMARSRMAITAVGTTLYELAYMGVPALVVANHESDRPALDFYGAEGPHLPLGIGSELSEEGLRAALVSGQAELQERRVDSVPGLGFGASRIAQLLMGRAERRTA